MYKYQNAVGDKRYESWKKDLSLLPLKFSYAGKEYEGLPFSKKSEEIKRENAKETVKSVLVLDKNVEISLELTHYYDYGATDFVVWFENVGAENSEVLENVRLDTFFTCTNPYYSGILGDHQNQYKPYRAPLGEHGHLFESEKGRPSHIYFPYSNLEHDDGGVMLAIGWAGRWERLLVKKNNGVQYYARYAKGLQTYLKPGEKIRTPLFLEAHYSVRDEHYATNYWRSWFMKYNVPKADGAGNELKPFSTVSIAGDTGLPNCDGSISENKDSWKPSLEKIFKEDVQIDYRWFDAGYYPDPSGATRNDYWGYVGAWVMDENKWGEGGKYFRESVDYAHERGMKTLLWVEAERVCMVDDLVKNYGYNAEWAVPQFPKEFPFHDLYILNDFSNPDCVAWVKENVFKLLKDNNVDMYREDFNRDPAYAWDIQDKKQAPNRWGITESKAVAAHYEFWQEIIKHTASYGGCAFLDSCASGGGRNDLQSLRYAVPVLRSDSDRTTTALRLSMSSSFNKWIPFHGACHLEKDAALECLQDGLMDVYTWRASYLPIMNVCGGLFATDENYDYDMLRFGLNEWKKVNPYLTKDFYAITPWHDKTDKKGFTVHAYIDPEKEEGVLLAFRMDECVEETLTLELPFADANDTYILTDEDTREEIVVQNKKLSLSFNAPRQAKLLWVKKSK